MSPTPRATYRLQLRPGFDFDQASAVLDYFVELGVSHGYFAPYLGAARGSTHGYDVVDPARVREELGGEAGHERLCAALLARGLGHMVDIVPNHMGIDSADNAFWADVLAKGRASRFACFFDIDWDADPDGKLVLPILAVDEAAALGSEVRLERDGGRVVLRAGGSQLPVSAETELDDLAQINASPAALAEVLSAQHYRLLYYRTGLSRLNYRRFLDVSTLAALRIDTAEVFEMVHQRILEWLRAGKVSAIRVDHPDGLADPEGYFRELRASAPEAWIVGEKVLSPGESLPASWAIDGTTGYEFLNLASGLFVNPRGRAGLEAALASFVGHEPEPLASLVREAKRFVISELLEPEVRRVTRLVVREARERSVPLDAELVHAAVAALALALDIGRTHARPGGHLDAPERAALTRALDRARREQPELEHTLGAVAEQLAHAPAGEACLRFQQLSSAAMAKGVEDTALYRHFLLTSLNEVGADLGRFGYGLRDLHQFCQRAAGSRERSLLATSTHDTKRAEDTRLRITALSEIPEAWGEAVQHFRALNAPLRGERVDAGTEYFLYQTLVGSWPISPERLCAYMRKAVREAKLHTSWLAPDHAYEAAVLAFAERVLGHADFLGALAALCAKVVPAARVHSLTQTLLKVTCPGIPDVYQGTELWDESLVDPDNRRAVDFAQRHALLCELRAGMSPSEILARMNEGLPKLWVLSQALALRNERPESLAPGASYEPFPVANDPLERIIAFMRGGDVLVIGQRFTLLHDASTPHITLPAGTWTNRLTGERHAGELDVGAVLRAFPAALLALSRG